MPVIEAATPVTVKSSQRRTPEQLKRHREYMRVCRQKDPEKFKARQRAFYTRPENKEKRRRYDKLRRIERLVAEAKKRAKKKGLDFTIVARDVVIPLFCPALDIPIIWGGPRPNWPSIDRLDNSRGYTPDNIRVISFRANNLKGDASADEAVKIALYMKAAR